MSPGPTLQSAYVSGFPNRIDEMTAPIAIIMGSQSDWETMRHAAQTLAALGIDCEKRIVSAHRTPDRLFAFAKSAKAAGFKIIIAGAGGAAHLPGMTASGKVKLKPGDTIGILGGGQLGRMLAMAAARLGLRCQVFSPDPDSPAFDVVQHATCAEYADVEALELFANDVNVITYEFENVPAATAMVLAARRPVLPAQKILETTQDRLIEKDFVKRLGIGTADYSNVP